MKLTDCKIVYICPDNNDKYHSRKLHMDAMLSHIGCKDIIHFKSSTENYPGCLSFATIDILTKYIDEPFLLLEDDVEFTGNINFDIPIDADAVYLGLSKCAGHPTQNIYYGLSQFIPYSDSQVRIMNMLSAHAIFFNSRRFKEAVIDTLKIVRINNALYNDVLISRLQSRFNIYGNMIPLFYQSIKFNPTNEVEKVTRFQLKINDNIVIHA